MDNSARSDDLDRTPPTDQLLSTVYDELRRMAAAQMANEAVGHTLQPTGLVHEAYLRLVGDGSDQWQNRGHFFAAAAKAMRRILIDHARRKKTIRQGGEKERLPLLDEDLAEIPLGAELLELDDALSKLAETQPEAAKLAELRVFAGLSTTEAARSLDVPERTARRTWQYARAWLRREMLDSGEETEN